MALARTVAIGALVWLNAIYRATIVPILANFSPECGDIINHSDAELLFISKDKYDNRCRSVT